jgi:hypothetical protein
MYFFFNIFSKEEDMIHPDRDISRALIQLCDALCSWERSTGRESVLILRERDGFVFRAMSGKPTVPDDVIDAELLKIIGT